MNPKLEGMDKPVQPGIDTSLSDVKVPSMESLKSRLENLFPCIVSDAPGYKDVLSTGHKEVLSAERKDTSVPLEDGTIVTIPSPADSRKTQEEILSSRDLFAKFGFDMRAFQKEVSAEPKSLDSASPDFREAFDEYADEDLYIHSGYGEKCEGTRRAGPNCMAYAYGMSREPDGSIYKKKPEPGHFAGLDTHRELSEAMENGSPEKVKGTFEKYMKMDMAAMGKELAEVDSNAYQPKAGERMFALVTAPEIPGGGSDFHFYVKDKNGYWSHKPCVTNPTIYVSSGHMIEDPSKCSRSFYTNFVGFYVIKDR